MRKESVPRKAGCSTYHSSVLKVFGQKWAKLDPTFLGQWCLNCSNKV